MVYVVLRCQGFGLVWFKWPLLSSSAQVHGFSYPTCHCRPKICQNVIFKSFQEFRVLGFQGLGFIMVSVQNINAPAKQAPMIPHTPQSDFKSFRNRGGRNNIHKYKHKTIYYSFIYIVEGVAIYDYTNIQTKKHSIPQS